jgi:hypothetical protein
MAFSHMFELGDHLALEIVRQYPDRFADGAVAFSPGSDLQLGLDHLLSEHMVLAAEAMRAGRSAAGMTVSEKKASLDSTGTMIESQRSSPRPTRCLTDPPSPTSSGGTSRR